MHARKLGSGGGAGHLKALHGAKPRRLLSILFFIGVCYFALVSFSTRVRDPEAVSRGAGVSHASRRALAKGARSHSSLHSSHGGKDSSSTSSEHAHGSRHSKVAKGAQPRGRGLGAHHAQRAVDDTDMKIGSNSMAMSQGSGDALRLLLASHGRLFWYYPDTEEVKVLHEGQGIHYGVFPGQRSADGKLETLWNVVRPHNWHPKTSEEHLVQLNALTGAEVSRVKLHSRFTHDAVRRGEHVYVCNTEGGEVQQLAYPSMAQLKTFKMFTLKEHVNTLAPLENGKLWVVLHNLGASQAVHLAVDDVSGKAQEIGRLRHVGSKSHGLVDLAGTPHNQLLLGQGGGSTPGAGPFLMLDSAGSALMRVDPITGTSERIYQVPADAAGQRFLKGLSVVGGVAYFGVSMFSPRSARADPAQDSELAAVHVASGTLLWRRRVPTKGLLNVVAAPHLGESSTYTALPGPLPKGAQPEEVAARLRALGKQQLAALVQDNQPLPSKPSSADATAQSRRAALNASHITSQKHGRIRATKQEPEDSELEDIESSHDGKGIVMGIDDANVKKASTKLEALGYHPKIGGHWSSGLPYLDLSTKDSAESWRAGIQLPLMTLDISKLKAKLLAMPDSMWDPAQQRLDNAVIDGRKDNMAQFKPGVEALYMIFSDQSTNHVYRFPYYDYFKAELEPILEQVLGKKSMKNIVRLQFSRMKPGSKIKLHRDMGGYAKFAHRVHIPIVTSDGISFELCAELERKGRVTNDRAVLEKDPDCTPIPMAEGMVFEINNRITHRVYNYGSIKRIQLVVDVAESVRKPRTLKPGTACKYVKAVVLCPENGFVSS